MEVIPKSYRAGIYFMEALEMIEVTLFCVYHAQLLYLLCRLKKFVTFYKIARD